MFHLAFTEAGAASMRPTAREWMDALDALRAHLRRCTASAAHISPDHLHSCPWCSLERQGVLHFLDPRADPAGPGSRMVLEEAWARIEAVPAPAPLVAPRVDPAMLLPCPLPPGVPGPEHLAAYRLLAVAAAALLCALVPQGWFFALLVGALGWGIATSFATDALRAERRRRRRAVEHARREHETLVGRLRSVAGPEGFTEKRMRLVRLRDEYRCLLDTEKGALERLRAGSRDPRRLPLLRSRVRARFAARRIRIVAALRAGPGELREFARAAAARVASARRELDASARRLAQAERDLAAVEGRLGKL
jgi:DNA-binding helix-hairpin-helix protein with protein kinase domain